MSAPVVLATRNAHKLAEVGRILAPYGLAVTALPAEVVLGPEDGDTYAANALGKARVAAVALGVAVIADDSGIEAAALAGRPGVHSARFAGETATDADNLALLIASVPAGSPLRYVCWVAWVAPDGEEALFSGVCDGTLLVPPRGEGGFGYDPAFLPDRDGVHADATGRSMAELSEAEKDRISHRGEAVRAFARWQVARGADPPR